jgi:multiple sugar transport system permease protein
MAVLSTIGTAGRPTAERGRRGDARAAWAFLAPSLAGMTIFLIGPVIASLVLSFFSWSLLGGHRFIGLENYVHLFTIDPAFPTVLGNTLIFTLVYTPLNLLLALSMALWLKTEMYGRKFFRLLLFLPTVTPMVANAVVWRFLLAQDGLVNQLLSVVGITGPNWLNDNGWAMVSVVALSVWQSFGYNVLVLGAGIDSIPSTLYEAASLDGAGRWQRFRSVTLPMLTPALFFAMVMTLIGALQVFAQPYILTKGGPGQSTNTVVLYLYQNGFEFDAAGYASAIGWVLFAVVMLITGLQFAGQKRWVTYDR